MYKIIELANGFQYFVDASGAEWYLHISDGLAVNIEKESGFCQICCAFREKQGPVSNFYIVYVDWTRDGLSPGKAQIVSKTTIQREFPSEYALLIDNFEDCKRRFNFYPYDKVQSIL